MIVLALAGSFGDKPMGNELAGAGCFPGGYFTVDF
jgi:hypothetical protein